jgi:hypothetical protein
MPRFSISQAPADLSQVLPAHEINLLRFDVELRNLYLIGIEVLRVRGQV